MWTAIFRNCQLIAMVGKQIQFSGLQNSLIKNFQEMIRDTFGMPARSAWLEFTHIMSAVYSRTRQEAMQGKCAAFLQPVGVG